MTEERKRSRQGATERKGVRGKEVKKKEEESKREGERTRGRGKE